MVLVVDEAHGVRVVSQGGVDLFEQTLNAGITPTIGVELLQLGPQRAQRLSVVHEVRILLQKHVEPEAGED